MAASAIVSFENPDSNHDHAVLVVGKLKSETEKTNNERFTVVNAFSGQEAIDIWTMLITGKGGKK